MKIMMGKKATPVFIAPASIWSKERIVNYVNCQMGFDAGDEQGMAPLAEYHPTDEEFQAFVRQHYEFLVFVSEEALSQDQISEYECEMCSNWYFAVSGRIFGHDEEAINFLVGG